MIEYLESKNPYWKKLAELDSVRRNYARSNQDTETHRGSWREQFAEKATKETMLHVELGCNAGHVVLEWAKQKPTDRFIGVDWKFKQIYRLMEKTENNNLKNLMAFRANQDRLTMIFGEAEIDFLYLYFPDPWPKKAQRKNRTFSASFLTRIRPLLSGRGYFHIKTDHPEYFETMLEEVAKVSDTWEVLEKNHNLHYGHPNPRALTIPEVTLFERLFIKDGLPIHSLKIRPRT